MPTSPKNDRLSSFPKKRSPLLIPKKRSPFAFLSQAMAILKFNQQDNSDRTFKSQRNCGLKVW
ncbi:MAG: hypothetical protein GPJ18_25655 [Microcystis aeruginosa F13-15]|nr:hypothetical protein [Microcystis aeruginosa F13-15]